MKLRLPLLASVAALAGCTLDATNPTATTGPGGAGGATSTSAAMGSSSTGASLECAPGTTRECYSGPVGTDANPPCAKGIETCRPDGSGYGACVGEVFPVAEDCASGVDSNCDGATKACSGDVGWAKRFGANRDDLGRSVAVDSMGNVVIAGSFQDTVMFGTEELKAADSGSDLFVAKLDPSGAVVWAFGFGANGNDQALSVAVGPNDSIVVGGSCEQTITFDATHTVACGGGKDALIFALSAAGVVSWAKAFAGSQDAFAEAVAMDATGNVLVGGRFRGALDTGSGAPLDANGEDGFVVKLDPQGAHLWTKKIGAGNDQDIGGVAFDAMGNALATGRARDDVDFGAGAVKNHGGYDVLVAKYAPDGALAWGQLVGDGSDGQVGTAVVADEDGNVFVTGKMTGNMQFPKGPILGAYGYADMFVAKLLPNGDAAWAEHFGGFPTDTGGEGVAVDAFGNVLVCGATQHEDLPFGGPTMPLENQGAIDGYLVKLDRDGQPLWAKGIGGSADDRCWGVAVRGTSPAIVGEMRNSVKLDSTDLASAGAIDVFAALLSP